MEELSEQQPTQKKGKLGLIIIIIVLLLGSGAAAYVLFQNQLIGGKTTTSQERDADTVPLSARPLSEEEEHSTALFRAVRIHRDTILKKFPLLTAMDEEDSVLELESYKTMELLNRDLNRIQGALAEFNTLEATLSAADKETREEILRSHLSEKGKTIALEGFNKLASDPERNSLTLKRYQTLRDVYQEWAQMHQFLLAHFDDYFIASRDNGQKSIFFYSDEGLTEYNARVTQTVIASNKYINVNQVLEQQMAEALLTQGIDVESQEFIDAVYN